MAIMVHRDAAELDAAIMKLGETIWNRIHGERPGLFNMQQVQGRLLEWVMRDPSFKIDLFRFVDVLPTLNRTNQVSQHIREYLLRDGRELPGIVTAALKAMSSNIAVGLGARTIKKNVVDMAERFIAGAECAQALKLLQALHRDGIAFSMDVLGETTSSDAEAAGYQTRYLALIDHVADATAQWPEDAVIDHNHLGPIPRANVSIKISALEPHLDPVDPVGSVQRVKARVLPLFLRAKDRNVFLNVDLEQWALHGITYDLFEEVLDHPELRRWPHVGIVVQAYLHKAQNDLDRLLALVQRRGAPITVRLVKGAYWDYEVVHAQQHGYTCPVFTDKAATDANYEQLTRFLLEHVDELQPAFGSHNLRSVLHALVLAQELHVPENAYEIQMLHGMAEPERTTLRALGHRVRVYAPVGELLPGMAYLVRRLLENTSNNGFLRLSHHEGVDVQTLLARPQAQPQTVPEQPSTPEALTTPFVNCPHLDFTDDTVRHAFTAAVAAVNDSLPRQVPVIIGGKPRASVDLLQRQCPSQPQQIVAEVSLATVADGEAAVVAAVDAWPSWRDRDVHARAGLLEALADRLQADRFHLAALQTFEVGKPWCEADADVAEGIDFCRYYARQALQELTSRRINTVAGEDNTLWYEGRGPTVVIAPWNFPLAILCGMTVAALVAGNTVILKPAEQSGAVALALYKHMLAAGVPPEVVQFVPGRGEEIGRFLVEHPHIAQIAFTGSKDVGLSIVSKAAQTQPGQPQVKRVVCEMGGKNAIIIDDDADLDEAVAGVMSSAFGYAGQKCSAASRVLIVGSVYETFISRLVEACRSLVLEPASQPSCRLGPVVDEAAWQRLRNVITHPGEDAEPLYIGEAPDDGWYVPPAIFAVHDAAHRLMQDEWFGPILAVMAVENFEAALDVALQTEFALTGAVYSRTPSHLEEATQRFRVGNLYLNQGSTGAMVQRQPFGGFGMSGIGTKAGGPGYLLNFADPRCVTENTMRRGFTPDVAL